mgnify:CR=1 FL=1
MKRKLTEKILMTLLWLCTLGTVAALFLILGYVLIQGLPHISLRFLTTSYAPGLGLEGIWAMIIGTLLLMGLTLVIAVPAGIFAAIYLSEYAKPSRFLSVLRFSIECLAGIPSILYGLFGFTFFVVFLKLQFSLISGALTLAIMILPLLIRTTEEALQSVPVSFREGSLALGANQLVTLFRIVLPSAIPGILTAVILSMGRIIGETAAVYYTAGTVPQVPLTASESTRSLAVHLYFLAKEGLDQGQAFASATILIIIIAALNLAAQGTANILNRRLTGK